MPPLVLAPLLTATAFTVVALTTHAATPLSQWGEAYPHATGHLVSGAVALLVAASGLSLARRTAERRARDAALALVGAWSLVVVALLVEVAGALPRDGSEVGALHSVGAVLLVLALPLVVAAHVAVAVVDGGPLPRQVRLGLAVTPVAWFWLVQARSGTALMLGLAATTAWMLVTGTALRRQSASGVLTAPPVRAAVLAGALWVPYGALELLTPWGADTRYDEAAGYDVVLDPLLHAVSSLPGGLALVLSGLALGAIERRLPTGPLAVRVAGPLTVGLGALSVAGVALRFDPLFTGARVLGTLVLGLGMLVCARAVSGRARTAVALVGVAGIVLLPLWPLVYAVEWLSPSVAAAIFVLHGAGWILLGLVGAGAATTRPERPTPTGPPSPSVRAASATLRR